MPDLTESVEIAASPTDLYALVSDLPRMGRFSPENKGAVWLSRGRAGQVGARFVGFNRFKLLVWITFGRVEVARPGEAFGFAISVGPIPVALWEYAFVATETGVRVSESWTDRRGPRIVKLMNVIFGEDRPSLNSRGIHATLNQLKKTAETAG